MSVSTAMQAEHVFPTIGNVLSHTTHKELQLTPVEYLTSNMGAMCETSRDICNMQDEDTFKIIKSKTVEKLFRV